MRIELAITTDAPSEECQMMDLQTALEVAAKKVDAMIDAGHTSRADLKALEVNHYNPPLRVRVNLVSET